MKHTFSWNAHSHSVKNCPTFYPTLSFIATFARAHHNSVSQAWWIQSITSDFNSPRSNLILLSHLCLGLPSGPFASHFMAEIFYALLIFSINSTFPTHLIFLNFISPTIFDENYVLYIYSLCNFLQHPATFSSLVQIYSTIR
jgi:hypothetical protein